MMTTEPISYHYAMNVKLSQVSHGTKINTVFPHVEDLMLTSRHFSELQEAVASINKLTGEITASLNSAVQAEQYATLSELNPSISGKETISKDWMPHEIAKMWIIDAASQTQQPMKIKAVGLVQLLKVHEQPVTLN